MILAQGLVLLFVWVLSITLGLWTVYVSKKGMFDDTLDIVSSALVSLLQDEREPARIRVLAERIQQLDATFTREENMKPGEYQPFYQVLDVSGAMLFHSPNAPAVSLTDARSGYHTVAQGNRTFRLRVREDPSSRIRVIVAVPMALVRTVFWRSVKGSPVQTVILFAVLALITWPMARHALKPLRKLATSVEARSPWDLSPLPDPPRLQETEPLVEALQRLFRRIGELLETQRRFIAEAAQELSTPIAAIGTQACSLQTASDEEQRGRAGEELQQGVARAARLVGQLLALARLETADEASTGTYSDLVPLVQERLGIMLPHALAKELDLGYEGPLSLEVPAIPAILVQAFDNLLENAIRHTPGGGRITFRVKREGGDAVVEVEDSGPGIPEYLRPAAFERFHAQAKRHPDGAGLGLAIVQQVARLHGGALALSEGAGGIGLRATLRLPLGGRAC